MLIEYTNPNTYTIPGFTFVPGVNECPNEIWDRIKKSKPIVNRLKLGHFKVIDEKSTTEDESPLKGLKFAECKELIDKCLDEKTLKTWASTETRKGVLKAIDEQIVVLDKVDEDEDEDGKEGE